MKLVDCIEMGQACGLDTVEESIVNVEIHALSLFDYAKMREEIAELRADAIANGIDYDKCMDEYNRTFNDMLKNANKHHNRKGLVGCSDCVHKGTVKCPHVGEEAHCSKFHNKEV